MANVDGKWECKVNSPMGEQQFTLTVASAGSSFTGSAEGGMGTMDLEGEVDGDELIWPMRVTKPMPITLNCRATISGDTLEGKVSAGFMGSFTVTGTRA
ncbi:hypothetical protein FHS31_000142 [Sphingomonas vulcanisoli]|uniref:Uncharacterized protein n=1 Tax=Sphingomonas vulcanisoli TaxID=1658060 RepID=A0ABX0TPL0_9SPHN|nr:hypothetical protein [Sphingomonas vulcanisoli]NIJ06560.1 hypothetical protein [Sphingomonas vulcanisoli]